MFCCVLMKYIMYAGSGLNWFVSLPFSPTMFLVWSQGGKSLDIFYSGGMRPIFCGNVEYNARQSELERLFRRYGKVDRVDMKSGMPRQSWFYVYNLFLTWYCAIYLEALIGYLVEFPLDKNYLSGFWNDLYVLNLCPARLYMLLYQKRSLCETNWVYD